MAEQILRIELMDQRTIDDLINSGILTVDKLDNFVDEAADILIASHKKGFDNKVSPDGVNWARNPEWYIKMKQDLRPLHGPTERVIEEGDFEEWKFKKINTVKMKDSLIKTGKGLKKKLEYKQSVKERARKTHYGGESEMILVNPINNEEKVFNIEVQARPHLGVSNEDVQIINRLFQRRINQVLEGF